MSWDDGSAPKRFYKTAEAAPLGPDAGRVAGAGADWTVTLDGKPIRTPAGAPFAAPRAAAALAAAEWAAQGERIAPQTMPTTRSVNSALDRIAPARAAVIAEIAGYGGSDLLCYRAEAPTTLIAAEAAAWDPILAWAAERFGARLIAATGVIHVPQPPEALAALTAAVAERSDLGLAALHELTVLSGSLLLALAADAQRLTPEEAWSASRINEDFQIAQWGEDAEAAAMAAVKRSDFMAAAALADALRQN